MTIYDWIPAISTTTLLAVAAWLMRSLITTRLTKSVQHEFDTKLEALRTEHRKSEESFNADLRAKDAQIELLRSGAISGLASRQAALDKRRIEAVDQLWSAVTELAHAKGASAWMATIRFNAAVKEAERNPKFRQLFEILGAGVDIKKIGTANASKVRPFVSEMAWAIFSAYQAILLFAVTQMHILKSGLNVPDVLDTSAINKLVEAVLPHHAAYLEKYGPAGYHYFVDELESLLLKELQNILNGKESDKASVEQAAAILQEVERVNETISNAATKQAGA